MSNVYKSWEQVHEAFRSPGNVPSREAFLNLQEAAQKLLKWADKECLPQGGKYDVPLEALEKAMNES